MQEYIDKIYQENKKAVFSYLYQSTQDVYLAEDLTQETFIKAFINLDKFRGDSSAKIWLFTIARNLYLDYQRKNPITKELNTDYYVDEETDKLTSLAEKELIRAVLNKLSEEERTIIILKDLQGFSYNEIGKIMKYSEGQVKINLHRTRKKFREFYQRQNKE